MTSHSSVGLLGAQLTIPQMGCPDQKNVTLAVQRFVVKQNIMASQTSEVGANFFTQQNKVNVVLFL